MINLTRNYPVLSSQHNTFKAFVADYNSRYTDWLTIIPFGGREQDREVAAQLTPGIDAGRLQIATGGHHGCLVIILAAGLQGKAIAVEDLSYPAFTDIAKLLGCTIVPCATDEHGLIPSALEHACIHQSVRGVYLMPTVHNPTGRVMPLDRRHDLITIARKHGTIILDDDAYGFLDTAAIPNFAQLAPDLGWYLNSVSKPLAPDIKVAYIASPPGTQDAIGEAIKLTTSNPSAFFTGLVSELIRTGQYASIVAQKRLEGHRRQELVRAHWPTASITAHPNSWHLWVNIPPNTTAPTIAAQASQAGVSIIPGNAFATVAPAGQSHIRVALGSDPDDTRLLQAITTLAQIFTQHQ